MAKSLRSKRKRKIRAEKRIVNAKKELTKLKEVVSKLNSKEAAKKAIADSGIPDVTIRETPMSVDGDSNHSNLAKTRTKSGKPIIDNKWMNQRKIKQIKNRIRKHNKRKARK